MLAFEKDVGAILAEASKYGEAIHLAKAARMIRHDTLQHKSHVQFNSTCLDGCLEDAVPSSLLQFVCMIEHGTDIKSQLHEASKSDLAMSHLLQYNCLNLQRTRKGPQSIGIPRTMKHRLQCILACICLLRQGRGNSLICCMRMGSVSPTPGSWKSQPSLERQ